MSIEIYSIEQLAFSFLDEYANADGQILVFIWIIYFYEYSIYISIYDMHFCIK